MNFGHGSTTSRDSPIRLFMSFVVVMLVAVLLLGLVLARSDQSEANRRGLAQGRSEAVIMAQTAIGPLLDGRSLRQGLSAAENADMKRLVHVAFSSHHVLRLRLRDLSGAIVFSNDGTGLHQAANSDNRDEIRSAASGVVVARVTRLNADNAHGPLGPPSVEVYLPLVAGTSDHRVGILEIYLPYAPISHDVNAGLVSLYWNLALGLGALYVLLFIISYIVSGRLRRQVKINAHLAEHDALTDLPNRMLFHRHVERALERDARRGATTMIAIVDLDRFKEINDTLGHHNGDRLLRKLSENMKAFLKKPTALARLGGDEFGVLLSGVEKPENVLRQLRSAIEGEIVIGDLPLSLEASIGFALSPDHARDADELLQLADVAMYSAKTTHAGVVRYDPSQNHYEAGNLTLIAELRQAIDSGQLLLHYQPKYRLNSGHVDAVEALVRWQHPTRGLLQPDTFIPLAEQTDLIDKLTEWVVQRALEDLNRFASDDRLLAVAVNVSARNLGRSGFAARVFTLLDQAGVAPDRLFVEITETVLMTDAVRAASVLRELDDGGVRISIDDFGTGQTSLGYLATLPIHELKIDRSFITDMRAVTSHAAIVHSIIELGRNLGFVVVGEGVETQDVLDDLASSGWDGAQGYFIARPMPASNVAAWLAQRTTPSR